MGGLRVGVEVRATTGAVTATLATLPWMTPERIALHDGRSLLLVSTSFGEPDEACAYAERRIRKSAQGLGIDVVIVSSEAFPSVVDIRGGSTDAVDDRRS